MKDREKYTVVGLMSGSSLDGLDVAICEFWSSPSGDCEGQVLEGKTFPFPSELAMKLAVLPQSDALTLAETDFSFSAFSAQCVHNFLKGFEVKPLLIASHGHTVFHQPHQGFTTQIGNGGILAAKTGFPVVCDFRTTDVGLGGQGAPLVPGAEFFLFSKYQACLNLGGIANISFPQHPTLSGFDTGPCNQLLNLAAGWLGLPFDEDGKKARAGKPIPELLEILNQHSYYHKSPPKSLGNEEVRQQWWPILLPFQSEPENVLHTLCLHISTQIAQTITGVGQGGELLVTGGGAFHSFLIDCLKREIPKNWKFHIPSSRMIQFKEAYCFAFLGLKRWLGEINCFSRHTGAKKDSCLGAIYL